MYLRALPLALLVAFAATTPAQDRFALIIGNGSYEGNALKNPPNDAAAVADALEKLDFQVTKKIDTDLPALEKAVVAFRKSLTKDSVALFFYAGHGLQLKGENFLMPIDAVVDEESQVRRKCYPVDELLSELESSPASRNILILDSCRNNPLTRSWTRESKQGLASITTLPNTIIAFSTAPGKVALDGVGNHSPFTRHLVASLGRRPAEGLEVVQALRATGLAVSKEAQSKNVDQRPWLNIDTSFEDFYLWRDVNASVAAVPKPLPQPTPAPTPPAEERLPLPRGWKRIDHPHDSKFESAENSIGMKFVVVPAGEFLMGSPEDDNDTDPDEKPQRRVRISHSTCFGMHEVTLGQFLIFYHNAKYRTEAEKDGKGGWGYDEKMEEFKQRPEYVSWTTGFKQTLDHPVVNVSWNDAQAFCKWLSEKEGQTYRLPTEAEWEYACRGGTKTKYWSGGDPELLAKCGNIADGTAKGKFFQWSTIEAKDGFVFSAPVGSFRPNPFGLYDMHGNAWEWCEDWYNPDEYGLRSEVVTNPKSTGGEQKFRVLRGGCWNQYYGFASSASRSCNPPAYRFYNIGFRVVLPRAR